MSRTENVNEPELRRVADSASSPDFRTEMPQLIDQFQSMLREMEPQQSQVNKLLDGDNPFEICGLCDTGMSTPGDAAAGEATISEAGEATAGEAAAGESAAGEATTGDAAAGAAASAPAAVAVTDHTPGQLPRSRPNHDHHRGVSPRSSQKPSGLEELRRLSEVAGFNRARSTLESHPSPVATPVPVPTPRPEETPPPVEQHTGAWVIEAKFDKIDKDLDGHLSNSELTGAIVDYQNGLSQEERDYVSEIVGHRDTVSGMSEDDPREEVGITRNDLLEFDAGLLTATFLVNHMFEIDADGNGSISAQESSEYVKNNKISSPQIQQTVDDFQVLECATEWRVADHNDEISKTDLSLFVHYASDLDIDHSMSLDGDFKEYGVVGARARSVYQQFPFLDVDNDGFVTADEAMRSSEQDLRSFVATQEAGLSVLFDDGRGTEELGVSRRDLQAIEHECVRVKIADNFDKLDGDKDGLLMQSEIEQGRARSVVLGVSSRALEFAYNHYADFASQHGATVAISKAELVSTEERDSRIRALAKVLYK